MSVSGDQTQIKYAVTHMFIQWSMILASMCSCEAARASSDLTATASTFVLVEGYHCSEFAKYISLPYTFVHTLRVQPLSNRTLISCFLFTSFAMVLCQSFGA